MKAFTLLLAGAVLGAVLNSGFFDEAQQAKQASTGWCVETCSKS